MCECTKCEQKLDELAQFGAVGGNAPTSEGHRYKT